jgi:hypothetical protein
MKVTPVSSPLPGEHLAGVSPVMKPEPDQVNWRSRLNFWTGRALTEQALTLEQDNRSARLAWRGRLVSPGVVKGLEVALEPRISSQPMVTNTLNGQFVHIMPGYGVMATGEDVYVPKPLRVNLNDVPVIYGQRTNFTETLSGRSVPQSEVSVVENPGSTSWFNNLNFGGKSIRWHLLNPRYVPWAAVLLLRPVTFESIANRDPYSSCPLDPSHDAFDDPRLVDASQLMLFMLPPSLRRENLLQGFEQDLTWRNRIATQIFEMEMKFVARQQVLYHNTMPDGKKWDTALVSDELLPWEYFGVPIGLVGFEHFEEGSNVRRIFIDRNAVVRVGGRARHRPRPAIVPGMDGNNSNPAGSGTPSIWQARISQFNEHLSDLLKDFDMLPEVDDDNAQQKCYGLRDRLLYLPPAGLLPRAALHFLTTSQADQFSVDDRADTSWFFPQKYLVRAVPVVRDEVEAIVAASAPLERFDLKVDNEPVCVLVPLPENKFDKDLLVIEKPDPLFQAEVERLYALRQDWRQRRDYVRGRYDDLSVIVRGGGNRFYRIPVKDNDQVEAEPTERLEGYPLACEVVPPSGLMALWKIDIAFTYNGTLGSYTNLIVSMHIDEEAPPEQVEFQWRLRDGKVLVKQFDTMPPVDVDCGIIMPGAAPQAVNLHRLFEFELDSVVFDKYSSSAQLIGVVINLYGGRASVAYVNAEEVNTPIVRALWKPFRHPEQNDRSDGWRTIAGALLLAPFEDLYKPLPADGSDFQKLIDQLGIAIKELTPELKTVDSRFAGRAELRINDIGLDRLIRVMDDEVNKASQIVSRCFGKIQASLQLLQSVITGESDAEQTMSSPSASAMVTIRGRNIAKTQVRESLTVNPNWTGISNIQQTSYRSANFNLDDTAEWRPRLMSFSQRFAYGPAYQAYQTMGTAMIDTIKSIAPLNVGFSIEYVPELKKQETTKSATRLTIPVTGSFDITLNDNRTAFSIGKQLHITNTLDASDYIDGTISSYDQSTGMAHVELLHYAGSGTSTSWTVSVAGKGVRFNELQNLSQDEISHLQFADIDAIFVKQGLSSGEIVSKGIRRADLITLILRKVESFITIRQDLVARARLALAAARQQIRYSGMRVNTINGKLAEVRHDLAVARTLWQEELDRVAAINVRRDELIAKEVKHLAFVRPRSVSLVTRSLPSCEFDRSDTLAPVPACFASTIDPPDELETYLQLFGHAPLRWFSTLVPLVRQINTRDRLMKLLEITQLSAARMSPNPAYYNGSTLTAMAKAYVARYQSLSQYRMNTEKQRLVNSINSWEEHYRLTLEHSTLGDLLDGSFGRNQVSSAAASELENIGKVATCLYTEFAAVIPGIRMAWVEQYSEFDKPAPLRDINALPRAESLSRLARKRFQAYINWLFSRIDSNDNDAINLISDLIRTCLLLASHAPVNRLILGHVQQPTIVRPGILIPVKALDIKQVRIGMQIQVWKNNAIVAGGVVENLRDQDVSFRVATTLGETTTIDSSMHIQFIPAKIK